jgi:hypothetical protein
MSERKRYSDSEIETIKELDELGVFGRVSPISEQAEKHFKEIFVKGAEDIRDAWNKFMIPVTLPRIIMRKPWHQDALRWTAEALVEILNEKVDESEGQEKITLDECQALVNALEAIRKKTGPGSSNE